MYSPPHKGEERILPFEKASENFQFFMSVRKHRVADLISWLAAEFGTRVSSGKIDIDDTLEWAAAYVGLLLPPNSMKAAEVYFAYKQPWAGEFAGANVLFDLSAMLGEEVISRRSDLEWRMEWSKLDYPAETTHNTKYLELIREREKEIDASKRERFSGYRRPVIVGSVRAADFEPIYDYTYSYFLFMKQIVAMGPLKRATRPKALWSGNRQYLKDCVLRAIEGRCVT